MTEDAWTASVYVRVCVSSPFLTKTTKTRLHAQQQPLVHD